MQLKITRLAPAGIWYAIDIGRGTRFAHASVLKRRLLDLGIGDSTIAAVFDMSPKETMTVNVPEKAAHKAAA